MSNTTNSMCTCQKPDAFRVIDQHVQNLVEQKPQAADSTFGAAVGHLVKVYGGIKPLLTVLASLPIIPANWRSVLSTFPLALDAVADGAVPVGADFKAGKDL